MWAACEPSIGVIYRRALLSGHSRPERMQPHPPVSCPYSLLRSAWIPTPDIAGPCAGPAYPERAQPENRLLLFENTPPTSLGLPLVCPVAPGCVPCKVASPYHRLPAIPPSAPGSTRPGHSLP